ncbi:MAG: MiaB/RimO family radical SAM methylthiotransferase [Candidatus Tyrphobacter sp.]
MARVYIETFGCQMNEADSQYIADRAAAAGYAIVDRPEEANVVVVNTCTVRESAERRAYGRMHHLKLLKERDPSVRLVVTGCLAEQDRDRMGRVAPHVDAVFGTSELVQLGDRLDRWRGDFDALADADEERLASDEHLLQPFGGKADGIAGPFSHLRSFVTVQRGCSYYCTFCIVPHVRGRFDHRPMHAIVDEVRASVSGGAREVTLVGQTVNAWRDAATGAGFGDLCDAICGGEAAPERLAFISPHPKDFTEAMIAGFARHAQLGRRVHLPLQSASDAVLRRMNRKYTRAQFEERVAWIERDLPGCAITTDIIVGFPSETEEDFAQTLEMVRRGIFANAYTFMYSPRRGTPAAAWEQVDRGVVAERFARVVEAANASTFAYHARKVGVTARCLVVGNSKKDPLRLAAKDGDNVTVVAPKPPDYAEAAYANTPWLDITIERAHLWGCTGSILRRAARVDRQGVTVPMPAIDLIAG